MAARDRDVYPIRTRIGDLFRVLRGKQPHGRNFTGQSMQRKMTDPPYSFHAFGFDPKQQLDWDDHYIDYAQEGYGENPLIFAAIFYKMAAATQAPLVLHQGRRGKTEAVTDHPLVKLLERPNPHMSMSWLMLVHTMYLNLSGNSYFVITRDSETQEPTGIYPLRPDYIDHIPSETGLLGYAYRPYAAGQNRQAEIMILPEDMIHVRYPDPLDTMEGFGKGLSPIRPIAWSGDIDNLLTRYLHNFHKSGMQPPGILKFQGMLTPEQKTDIQRRWTERYGGAQKWHIPAVLDERVEYERIGLTFDEMDVTHIDNRTESRIMMTLGVPGLLLGTQQGLENNTYSNYEQAREQFWQDRMLFELRMAGEAFELRLTEKEDDYHIVPDVSQVPAFRLDIVELTQAAQTMFSMGTPPQIAYQVAGIDMPEYEGWDLPFGGMRQVQPLALESGDTNSEPDNADEAMLVDGETDNLNDSESDDPEQSLFEQRVSIIKQIVSYEPDAAYEGHTSIAEDYVGAFQLAATRLFNRQRIRIQALLTAFTRKSRQRKATPVWTELLDEIVEDLLSDEAFDEWREEFEQPLNTLAQHVSGFWQLFLSEHISIDNEDFLQNPEWVLLVLLDMVNYANDTSIETIRKLLESASSEDWTYQRVRESVEALYDQWSLGTGSIEEFEWLGRIPNYRALLIARKETLRATNLVAFNKFKDWSFTAKAWWTRLDDRVRPAHAEAHGQTKMIDQPFDVGGEKLHFPQDTSLGATAENVMGCRCIPLPVP